VTANGAVLETASLTKRFGGLVAVDDVSLCAQPGRVTALIGPNGAGKTTLYDCLTGRLTPEAGMVRMDGADITGLRPHERALAGIGRTFQRLEIFDGLTVQENLQVALETRVPRRNWWSLLTLGSGDEPAVIEEIGAVIARLGLDEVANVRAGDLPTGILRLVELGRALCTRPRVLLLDEPASGQDAQETAHLQQILSEFAAEGMTIVLVEHDVELVMNVSDWVYVMEFGRLIASGTPAQIRDDSAVREAYLGVEENNATARA
jgi:branched-chain amino acid transport system ATP-binding protein